MQTINLAVSSAAINEQCLLHRSKQSITAQPVSDKACQQKKLVVKQERIFVANYQSDFHFPQFFQYTFIGEIWYKMAGQIIKNSLIKITILHLWEFAGRNCKIVKAILA